MKKPFLIGLFCTIAACVAIAMQFDYVTSSLDPGITNVAANNTNSTKGVTYTFTKTTPETITLFVSASGLTSGTTGGSLTTLVEYSYDGTNWDTQPRDSIALTMTGVSTNQTSKVLTLGGCQYMRLGDKQNTAAGIVTNMTYKFIGLSPR